MIETSKLLAVDEIIVHDNCSDGTASAMILHDCLPNAKVTFLQHGTEPYRMLEPRPGQLFCDISPDPARIKEFLDVGVLVLDHHKKVKNAVMPFVEAGLGAFGDEVADPGVSGAMLAFREVWLPLDRVQAELVLSEQEWARREMLRRNRWIQDQAGKSAALQDFATLIGIRDTWQKQDTRWRQACEVSDAVHFWPWEELAMTDWSRWPELLKIGPILYERSLRHVDKAVKGAHRFVSEKGRRVMVFEGTKPTSDASEKMADENDLTIGFALFVEEGVQKMVFSTRSRGSFDCNAFSAAHGGGGHTNAAGFNQLLKPMDLQPFALVEQLVRNYEGVEDDWKALFTSEQFKNQQLPADIYQQLVKDYRWNLRS